MRHRHIRRISQQRIRPCDIQRPGRNLHPRPRNHPVIDRLLHIHVSVARALGLQITNRGKSIFQRPPRIHRRENRAVLRRFLQQLKVIIRGSNIAVEQDVRVRINQPRQASLV